MQINIRPKKAAAYRLGLAEDALHRVGDNYYAVAPVDLNPLLEYTPAGVTFHNNPRFAQMVTIIDDTGIEQVAPHRRMFKQLLANRPQWYLGSSGNRAGDQKAPEEPDCFKRNGSMPSRFSMNKTYLEQLALSSAYPFTRRVKDVYDHVRAKGDAPCTYAVTGGGTTKLLMKSGPTQLTIKRKHGDGSWRQSESDIPNDILGWGDWYSRSASDEPDEPWISMNYVSMWRKGNAPVVCLHPAHQANPTTKYTFYKKASDRHVDRDWHEGEGNFTKHELYSLFRESCDYGSYGYTSVFGNFTDASCGDQEPAENDTPINTKAQTMALASNTIMKQAAELVWRDWLITLFLSDHESAYPVDFDWTGPSAETPRNDLSVLWFADKITQTEEMILKAGIQHCDFTTPTGEQWASLGGLGVYGYAYLSWGTTATTKSISWLSSYAAPKVTVDKVAASKVACSMSKPYQSGGWTDVAIASYVDFTYPGMVRPLLGEAAKSGSWEKVASGRIGKPSVLYAPADAAKGVGCHIEFDRGDTSLLSSTGNVVTRDDNVLGSTAVLLAGYQVGCFNNCVAGFFEDWIDPDVSDWDTGGEFFVFFLTQTPEEI